MDGPTVFAEKQWTLSQQIQVGFESSVELTCCVLSIRRLFALKGSSQMLTTCHPVVGLLYETGWSRYAARAALADITSLYWKRTNTDCIEREIDCWQQQSKCG